MLPLTTLPLEQFWTLLILLLLTGMHPHLLLLLRVDPPSLVGATVCVGVGGHFVVGVGIASVGVMASDAIGTMVPPRPSPFVSGWSFARVVKSATHLPKGTHPLPCAKTSPVVVYGLEVVENVDFYQHRALVCKFTRLWTSLLDLHCWVSDS